MELLEQVGMHNGKYPREKIVLAAWARGERILWKDEKTKELQNPRVIIRASGGPGNT